jgi:quercetin dioxygenase-like cupin family protein
MPSAGDQLFNPLTGERIVFRATASETGGALLEMDAFWPPGGRRAAQHAHPQMQERWEVIAGRAAFLIDGVERTAAARELLVADPGVAHLAWNPATEPAHVRIQMRPALRWERFVQLLFALCSTAHAGGRNAPDPQALLMLLRDFPHEIALPRNA